MKLDFEQRQKAAELEARVIDDPTWATFEIVELADRVQQLEIRIREYQGALIWCSASDDFQKGGRARKGWLKIAHLISPAALASSQRSAP